MRIQAIEDYKEDAVPYNYLEVVFAQYSRSPPLRFVRRCTDKTAAFTLSVCRPSHAPANHTASFQLFSEAVKFPGSI